MWVGVASAFTLVVIQVLCFPTVREADLDAQSMDLTVVVWGGANFWLHFWGAVWS